MMWFRYIGLTKHVLQGIQLLAQARGLNWPTTHLSSYTELTANMDYVALPKIEVCLVFTDQLHN